MLQSTARTALETLQKGEPALFWQERWENPDRIGDWETLALAPTAWAWLQQIPGTLAPAPTNKQWQLLWSRVADWPMEIQDVLHVDHAIQSWSDYSVWSAASVSKIVHRLENVHPRSWHHNLMSPEPNTFEYHLLHTVCLGIQHFTMVSVASVWNTVAKSASLRSIQKEMMFLALLKVSNDRFPWENSSTASWYTDLPKHLPHLKEWFDATEAIKKTLDIVSTRGLLVEQWTLKNEHARWAKQMNMYNGIHFDDSSVVMP